MFYWESVKALPFFVSVTVWVKLGKSLGKVGCVTTGRVLVLIQVGVAALRRAKHTPKKQKQTEQRKRNTDKERAAALNRLPTRPLFLLSVKSCVVKTFV